MVVSGEALVAVIQVLIGVSDMRARVQRCADGEMNVTAAQQRAKAIGIEMRMHAADLTGRETGTRQEHQGFCQRVHGASIAATAAWLAVSLSARFDRRHDTDLNRE